MQKAMDIADRYDARGKIFPRYLNTNNTSSDPSRVQEYKDADKLKYWKNAFGANNVNQCPVALTELLDSRMPGAAACH